MTLVTLTNLNLKWTNTKINKFYIPLNIQDTEFFDRNTVYINRKTERMNEEKKIKLNVYFHTSLWCLKRFYEGLKGLHKTFWGTTKKCENKNLS